MSRGVVLWPDPDTTLAVREVWEAVAERGLPSLHGHTHRRHRPHCSLSVAEDLEIDRALDAVGELPSRPIPLRVEAVGVFPPGGVLFLSCVVNDQLLREQRRIDRAVGSLMVGSWPYFRPGRWVPHITVAMSATPDDIASALPIILERLPIEGTFDEGGIEDGTTGESWWAPRPG